MKILVFGADGFIGKAVVDELKDSHEVYEATRQGGDRSTDISVDLVDADAVSAAIRQVKPDVVINAAGIVENTDAAKQNVDFTRNIVEAIISSELESKPKLIICGSAAEYGQVDEKNIPVKEGAPLNAKAGYGLSKSQETELALKLGAEHHLRVAVARIFNPIGIGMHSKFLIPRMILQVEEFKAGKRECIEGVTRLDSRRDYVNVQDVAVAIRLLATQYTKEDVYNIGSGVSTSNGELIELIISYSNLSSRPEIVETMEDPERLVATQADTTRITDELGWRPTRTIEETIKRIIDGKRH